MFSSEIKWTLETLFKCFRNILWTCWQVSIHTRVPNLLIDFNKFQYSFLYYSIKFNFRLHIGINNLDIFLSSCHYLSICGFSIEKRLMECCHSLFLIWCSQSIKLESSLWLYHIVEMHEFILCEDLFIHCYERTVFFQKLCEDTIEPALKLLVLFHYVVVTINNLSWFWPDFTIYVSFLIFDVNDLLLLWYNLNWNFFFNQRVLFVNIVSKSSQNDSSDSNFRPVLFYLVHWFLIIINLIKII